MYEKFDPEDSDQNERIRAFIGPDQVDKMVRQAIQFCWIALPNDKRTIDEVEKQIRRVVERAIRDFREDADAFGFDGIESE